MGGPRLKLFGLVLAGALAGAACGSDTTTSSTNAPPADTAVAVGTDPAAPPTDAPPDGQSAVEAFWAEAIAACNEQSLGDLGTEAFDGSAADPTVGVTFDDEVSPGVYRIEDADGVVLLVDVGNRVVTGPDGPDGIMPRNYIFVCPEAIFVGAFDEDGMMDDEGGDDEGAAQLYLQADGLGVVEFGSSPETTISLVSGALGPLDADTGWIDSFSAWGTCPGPMIRVVRWWNLDVLFTDGDTEYGSSGEPHFFNWRAPDLDGAGAAFEFTTRAGIGLGSTVEQLRSVYGEDVVDYDPDFDYWYFNVTSGDDAGVSGSIEGSGAATDPVRFIEAGALCGE